MFTAGLSDWEITTVSYKQFIINRCSSFCSKRSDHDRQTLHVYFIIYMTVRDVECIPRI